MNLYEYQAKKILIKYNLPVLQGRIFSSIDDIKMNYTSYLEKNRDNNGPWIVKCQIRAGGRGKAGGIKIVQSITDILSFANTWFGKYLITHQTTELGELVSKILIEPAVKIIQELYLSISIDRNTAQIICMASNQGGIDIEAIGILSSNLIHRISINPITGVYPYQGRILARKLGLSGIIINKFSNIIVKIIKLFIEKDLLLLEINPLVITTNNDLICLDAKITTDDNSIFRQSKLLNTCIITHENKVHEYEKWNFNYVSLTGNIGCMVNGAGLAMATMDLIQKFGGMPANFLDIGGDASKEDVISSFKIILKDKKVKAILVNIFGGIICCDLIADSIITALSIHQTNIPIVVRLEGNNSKLGLDRLINSKFNMHVTSDLNHAIHTIITMVK